MTEAVDRSLFTDLIDVEGVLGIDLGITNIATDAESCWLSTKHESNLSGMRPYRESEPTNPSRVQMRSVWLRWSC